MDRAEAIRELTQWRDQMKSHGVPNYGKKLTALDLAIEALKDDTHSPKCGTIVRDGRQYHDLVYRGEVLVNRGDAEFATTTDCISRQDAINAMCRECSHSIFGEWCMDDCTEVAILKNLPPVNQKQITGKLEPVENATSEGEESTMGQPKSKLDLISRQEVLGYIDRLTGSGLGKVKSLEYIKKYVERMESSERESGEWIKNDDYVCDQCGYHMIVGGGAYNFCPNCGAKMNKGGDDNE